MPVVHGGFRRLRADRHVAVCPPVTPPGGRGLFGTSDLLHGLSCVARLGVLVCLLVWLLVGCAHAPRAHATLPRPTTPPVERAPAEVVEASVAPDAEDTPRAWLYRVEGGASPSYLFGTMHVGVAFPRALPPPLDAALYASRTLVMEIDIRAAARFLREGPRVRRARSEWIDRALPRETWRRLCSELSYVAAPEQIAPLPAGALAAYLRQVRMAEIESTEDGWDRIPGTASPTHLDRWIYDWADAWRMPMVALETPEEAVEALSAVPRPNALSTLRQIIDDAESARDEARRLRHAYLSLDEAEVRQVLSAMSEAEREATFHRRNEAWLTRLLPELREGNAFVAVGLAHLVGDGSLIALLEREGFTVERVLGDGGFTPTDSGPVRLARAE